MTLYLEHQKLKRTGYFPAFLAGGALAGAFPLANMLVRPETFTSLPGDPFYILMHANWQMMAMLNLLLIICGACIMYHTEYADNGGQKMEMLPLWNGKIFLGKFVIAISALALMVLIETAVLAGCSLHWFPGRQIETAELFKCALFQWGIALPTVMFMQVVASACKNMWVSLGIGVILVFTLSIFPQENPVRSFCPFGTPYQTFDMAVKNHDLTLLVSICAAETVLIGLLQLIYQKNRRCTE